MTARCQIGLIIICRGMHEDGLMVQLLSVTCAALGLLHPQLTSPFDCSDSCRTVRGPQEPAWSRGFYARVCDVSLTLRARVCYAPRSHGAGHLRRDVCRNAIMCICALWRPPCTAAVCKVLPPCRWGGGAAQRLDVRGDPSLSAVWKTRLQMVMGSILLRSSPKG